MSRDKPKRSVLLAGSSLILLLLLLLLVAVLTWSAGAALLYQLSWDASRALKLFTTREFVGNTCCTGRGLLEPALPQGLCLARHPAICIAHNNV